MNTKIIVEVKNVYGNQNIYVVSEHKEMIAALTGAKTLSYSHIEALKKLGFEIVQSVK